MSGTPHAQRIAERLIRASCRRLPGELRAERCREWSAELPAILHDETIRPGLIRALRALSYSVGVSTATRRLSRAAGRSRSARAPEWRDRHACQARQSGRQGDGRRGGLAADRLPHGVAASSIPVAWLGRRHQPGVGCCLRGLLPGRPRSGRRGALPAEVGMGTHLHRPDPVRGHRIPERRPGRPGAAGTIRSPGTAAVIKPSRVTRRFSPVNRLHMSKTGRGPASEREHRREVWVARSRAASGGPAASRGGGRRAIAGGRDGAG